MANVVNHEVTNLMIPAFGSMRLFVNEFNPTNGYELEANSVTFDQVPFRPQSVTIDATDVPTTEEVVFTINQINFNKVIKGGNTVTFNFPSITNMVFTVLPSDGTSAVRAFFYNFPSFVDFDGVQQVEVISGGGGVQDVNLVSPDPVNVAIVSGGASGGLEFTGNFASNVNLAANTAQQVFAPAANVNGCDIIAASMIGTNAALGYGSLIAKAGAAPVTTIDGIVICSSQDVDIASSDTHGFQLPNPIRIPAGLGLYFISNLAETFAIRSVLYKML